MPEYEVFLVGSIDTAFSIWDVMLQVLSSVRLSSFFLLSQSIISRIAWSPCWVTTHCESAKF